MTYQEAINKGKQLLVDNQIFDGFGFRLMLEMCELESINLYTDKDSEADPKVIELYFKNIDRLIKHEPLAYILGFEWFYGRRFIVNEKVLIPREETEELVGFVLNDIDRYFKTQDNVVLFDIATGSGNLGLTFKLEEPNLDVYVSDISEDALAVAQQNALNLNADITFLRGDMGQPFSDRELRADILVCNPPYITTTENVERSVIEYEPHIALFGGVDGLDFYRQVLDQAAQILKHKSMMAFEMGFNQRKNMTKEIKQRFPEAKLVFEKDMNGLDRMCFVYFNID
jgi:release factor glutamine methyltransferase